MITVSFDDIRRWRSFRTLALMDGDRGLAPKSGHSISSGSDSIPLMGMGPGSSGMMPLSSIPWWIRLALRQTRSVASEVKLPGSETMDGWGEVEKKGESEKGEQVRGREGRKEGKQQGRMGWGEITYEITFSFFLLALISPWFIPRNHTLMIVYSILVMHGHCMVYMHAIQWTMKLKTSQTRKNGGSVASDIDDVTFSRQDARVGWARD